MSADAVNGDSPIWNVFRDIIFSNQSQLAFSDWVIISRSFGSVKDPVYNDRQFWNIVETKLSNELQNHFDTKTIAGICYGVEGSKESQISKELKEKL
jgi:hypothetical protein